MKAHIGVDAGSGYTHTVRATGANEHDITQASPLIRKDDKVVLWGHGLYGNREAS